MVSGASDTLDHASPWGPEDEIGRLNLITAASRTAAMMSLDPSRVFDLSVELAIGMPTPHPTTDISFQIWQTVRGAGAGEEIGFFLDSFAMPTHCGTHLDAFCHAARSGMTWNGVAVARDLGDRTWHRCAIDRVPAIIARGILIDVAGALEVPMIPAGYEISLADVEAALSRQRTVLREGDVVLVRTGRMAAWPDPTATLVDPPGIAIDVARHLVEVGGAMIIGSDTMSVERAFGDYWTGHSPGTSQQRAFPVHEYCLTQVGAPLLEFVDCEALAAAAVHEFCFVGAPLRLKGATGAPIRPLAIAYQRDQVRV